jgi:hypothetical protein
MKNAFLSFAATLALLMLGRVSFGQPLYSYVDENGVRVFTNIPPVRDVQDLVVIGSAPSPTTSNSMPESESYDAIIENMPIIIAWIRL